MFSQEREISTGSYHWTGQSIVFMTYQKADLQFWVDQEADNFVLGDFNRYEIVLSALKVQYV